MSKENFFSAPMTSGGGLTDLISWCLVFGVGFHLGPSKKDLYIAFDGTENLQKGQRSAQYSVPPSKVQRGRVGIPGDFSVPAVRVVEVAGWGNGIGRHQGRRTWGLFPDVLKDLSDLMWIGDEGDDPHRLPALAFLVGVLHIISGLRSPITSKITQVQFTSIHNSHQNTAFPPHSFCRIHNNMTIGSIWGWYPVGV